MMKIVRRPPSRDPPRGALGWSRGHRGEGSAARAMHAALHCGQMPCVRSPRMAVRAVASITTHSPPMLRTRAHHAHSEIQMRLSRETPYDAVAWAAASRSSARPFKSGGTSLVGPVSRDTAAPGKEKPNETFREASPPRRSIGTDRHSGGCKGRLVPVLCHLAYIVAPAWGRHTHDSRLAPGSLAAYDAPLRY